MFKKTSVFLCVINKQSKDCSEYTCRDIYRVVIDKPDATVYASGPIAMLFFFGYLAAYGASILCLQKRAESAIKYHTRKSNKRNDNSPLYIGHTECERR